MFICITEVDAVTKIVCTDEPQRTGPSMPEIKGFVHTWHNSSAWPIKTASDGTYLSAPRYYGTCDDDAYTSVAGVLQVLTQAEYDALKVVEHEARKPYPSWIGYSDTMTWAAPIARPADAVINGGNVRYQWDEATVNWIPRQS